MGILRSAGAAVFYVAPLTVKHVFTRPPFFSLSVRPIRLAHSARHTTNGRFCVRLSRYKVSALRPHGVAGDTPLRTVFLTPT